MQRVLLTIILLAFGAGGIGWAFWYTQEGDVQAAGPPRAKPSVVAEAVTRGDIQKEVRFAATLEPSDMVTLLPKLTGHLEEFKVDLGDPVTVGEVIAILDQSEFQQRVKQAEASLTLAKAQLNRAVIVRDAARREYDRARNAHQGGLSPEQELDTRKATLDTATADVELAAAEVAREEAILAEATLNLENTVIRAPMSGQIDTRMVDVGALVSPSTPLCTIVRTDPIKVIVDIPEREIRLARSGVSATVLVPAADLRVESDIVRAAPTIDANTRTGKVELSLPNTDGALRPGMYADVGFVAAEASLALLIPETALLQDTDQLTVNRIDGDVVQRVPVEIGISANRRIEIRGGLNEGDLVITRGNFMVEDGDAVDYTLSNALPVGEED